MFSTAALARSCARRPWRTIGAWVAGLVVAIACVALFLGGSLTTEAKGTNDPESQRAERLVEQHFPLKEQTTEVIVVRSERLTVDDSHFRREALGLLAQARNAGLIEYARNYYDSRDRSLVSADRHATLIPLRLRGDPEETVKPLIALVRKANGKNGFTVAMTGSWTTDHDFNDLSQRDLKEGELRIGVPAALVVLVLVFGTLVAAATPLLLALVSIIVALGLTALIAQAFELSIFVVNMLTGMGLALGIDYSLFVLSRFREERRAGRDKLQAIEAAGATASRAVFFSGSAYVVAMIGLLLVPSNIMRSLAVGAILVGIASVIAALTLLPALLSLLGDRVNNLPVPLLGRRVAQQGAEEGRFWRAIVERVMRRPVVSLVLAAAILLAAATPVLGIRVGSAGISTLPDRLASKQGYVALERSFPAAGAEPAQVVIQGPPARPDVRAAIRRLQRALARDRDFGKSALTTSPRGDVGLVTVPVATDPASDRAVDAIRRLRHQYIPRAFAGVDAPVLVGGQPAENVDYYDTMRYWLPIVFAFVLVLSFLVLTVAFRSLVVAAKAIVLNLLSVGAAYGLLVLVFQHGYATGFFGFQKSETTEAWVPLFLFAVLFGLSMDYQVFLLSRIRERYSQTRDNARAVAFGIVSTARLITGAALIIVAVFIGFATGELVMFQQMGFGVAVALLIDATLVRSVLVPAAMRLLGDWNWYLPRRLEWIPHVELGEAPVGTTR